MQGVSSFSKESNSGELLWLEHAESDANGTLNRF